MIYFHFLGPQGVTLKASWPSNDHWTLFRCLIWDLLAQLYHSILKWCMANIGRQEQTVMSFIIWNSSHCRLPSLSPCSPSWSSQFPCSWKAQNWKVVFSKTCSLQHVCTALGEGQTGEGLTWKKELWHMSKLLANVRRITGEILKISMQVFMLWFISGTGV